jgi:NADH:ubiquinone oxidoreductase subunit 6 (subunit J)
MKRLLQLGIFIVFVALLVKTIMIGWYTPTQVFAPSTTEIGQAIFTKFVLPFEIISLVLLAAMIGAIIIAKKEVGS